MLAPRKVKFRKWQRGGPVGRIATRKYTVDFGQWGLKATEGGLLTARQLEASRRAMTRFVQRGGKIWIRVFTDHPMSFKGAEVGMGGGKGSVDHYIVKIRPGTVLFEMDGVTEEMAREAMRLAAHKLPVTTTFVKRSGS